MTSSGRPTGKAALFGAPVPPAATPTRTASGSRALYSSARAGRWRVAVSCSRCGARTPLGLLHVGRRLLRPGSFFWPLRHHPHRMSCPACGRMSWCRVTPVGSASAG